jgi:hypothetical protein
MQVEKLILQAFFALFTLKNHFKRLFRLLKSRKPTSRSIFSRIYNLPKMMLFLQKPNAHTGASITKIKAFLLRYAPPHP